MDKLQNKIKEVKSGAREKAGDATGNEQLQAEGQADQSKGNLKQAFEKVKGIFT